MADPGSVVHQGREGTGAATIFQPSVNPLTLLAQDRASRARNEANSEKLKQQQRVADQKELERFYSNIDKPSQFQLQKSVEERDNIRKKGIQTAISDPTASIGQMKVNSMKDISEYNRRNARRNEIQNVIKNNLALSKQNDLDDDFVNLQHTWLMKKDVDESDPAAVAGIIDHPRAFKANEGIVDTAQDIKNQLLTSTDGQVKASDYGFEFDNNLQKYRFKVYPTGPRKGEIVDEVVEYVLDNDKISDRLRWDIAAEEVMGGNFNLEDLSPEQLQEIDDRFEQIQFSNDPSVIFPLYDKVRSSLDQMQTSEIRNKKNFKAFSSSERSKKQDIPLRRVTVQNIMNAVTSGGDVNDIGAKAVQELVGGKVGSYPITSAEVGSDRGDHSFITEKDKNAYQQRLEHAFGDNPELLSYLKKAYPLVGKPALKFKVRTTTIEGLPQETTVYVDLSKKGVDRELNTILNSVQGNNKIPNEELFEDENTPGYLDEDDGYLDE